MLQPYEILGVKENATFEEIKRAYHSLSLKYHPDMHNSDESELYTIKMAEINSAFEYYKNRYTSSNNSSYKQDRTTNKQATAEERRREWERWQETWKMRNQAAYRASGKKMRDKIARNLDPILDVNKKFKKNLEKCSDFTSLYKLANDYSDTINEMILMMYEYTEKYHRYGMPPESFYYTESFDENVTKNFPLTKVDSSQIDATGYDKENQLLYIRFSQGNLYVYYNVVEYIFEGFLSSDSKGNYFGKYIRNNYKYTRLD